MFLSLRVLAPLSGLLMVAIVLAYSHFAVERFQRQDHLQSMTVLLKSEALWLQGQLAARLRHNDHLGMRRDVVSLGSRQGVDRVAVLDASDRVLASNRLGNVGLRWPAVAGAAAPAMLVRARANVAGEIAEAADADRLVAVYPVLLPSRDGLRPTDVALLIIELDLSIQHAAFSHGLLSAEVDVLAASVGVLFLFGLAVHFLFSRRIRRLADAASRIASGDLSVRSNVGGRDELAGLSHSFNMMMDGLDDARRDLERSETRFRDFADAASDWFWEMGPDLRMTYMSERVVEITGKPAAWHLGKTRKELADPVTAQDPAWQRHFDDLEQHRPFRDFSFHRTAENGAQQWFTTSGKPIFDADGNFLGYRGIASDTSARKRIEQAFEDAAQRTRAILSAVPDPVITIDVAGTIRSVNLAAEELLGYPRSKLVGRNVKMLMPGDVAVHHDGFLRNYVETGETKIIGIGREVEALRADGTTFTAELRISEFYASGRRMFTGVLRDITERKLAEAQLRELATTDPLTGLKNRRAFEEHLSSEFERWRRYGQPSSLILIDADHFKRLNDSFGHQAGDEVLKVIGQICLDVVRSIDTVARLGGEEFCILLPSTGVDDACAVAERIRQLAEARVIVSQEHRIPFTLSFGVSEASKALHDSDKLLRAADEALYAAKEGGRNRVLAAAHRHIEVITTSR